MLVTSWCAVLIVCGFSLCRSQDFTNGGKESEANKDHVAFTDAGLLN